MFWIGEQRISRPLLHDLSRVHDGDSVSEDADDREIVRDEEIGQTALLLKLEQKIEDARLNRDVE